MFRREGFGNDCDLCKNPAASNPASTETKGDGGASAADSSGEVQMIAELMKRRGRLDQLRDG
jgi:hypothetical protein